MEQNKLSSQKSESGRVEAFSDGVFAIAITLLILNIKVPRIDALPSNNGLLAALFHQWPAYLAFFISFLTILIMWVNHHNLFNFIHKVDSTFLYLNGFVLLTVTFIPFPTSLLSEHIQGSGADIASSIYAGTFFLNCLSYYILWLYSSKNKRLLDNNIDTSVIPIIRRNIFLGLVSYIVAFAFAFISVKISIGICFILALFYAIIGSLRKKSMRYEG